MSKTHYRKVFKSDHLGVADLEDLMEAGKPLIFTIKEVKQEFDVKVAGKKGNHNIAYFHEKIKPLVVNAGNSKILSAMAGSKFVEDWSNLIIQLYIDPTAKFGGEVTGGVRINPEPPKKKKPEVTPDSKAWPNAIAAYRRDGNFDKVLEHAIISEAYQKEIIALVKAETAQPAGAMASASV
jgi:hypothetical protein